MRIGRALTAVVCGALAVGVAPAAARAERGLLVGVSENGLKYEAPRTAAGVDELGARGVRITVAWDPTETVLAGEERQWLDRAVSAAGPSVRIVLAAYGPSASAPDTDAERGRYCSYVGSALARYARIHDVVIWNEPNKSGFWRQQYDGAGRSVAPAMYEALLAHCYDVLHKVRADVNVLTSTSSRGNDDPNARSNVSHSPGTFIRGIGEAYRASGRTKPIFDTVGHHPYGEHSGERPWRRHPLSSTIGEGDWDKLVQAYHDAFAGTLQPNPGRCVGGRCASIWYMEVGYQTTLEPAKAGYYRGTRRAAGVAAGRAFSGAGSRHAARRRHPPRVLPTVRRRLLQLPAPGRTGPRGVAVRRPLGRRYAQGLVLGIRPCGRRRERRERGLPALRGTRPRRGTSAAQSARRVAEGRRHRAGRVPRAAHGRGGAQRGVAVCSPLQLAERPLALPAEGGRGRDGDRGAPARRSGAPPPERRAHQRLRRPRPRAARLPDMAHLP
jgi:hypothetical protein